MYPITGEHVRDIFYGRSHQLNLLHEEPALPQWARVDISRARVERLRKFGEVYVGLALWRRLRLDAFFNDAMARDREKIAWGTMACILILVRSCAPSSELQIAEFWYAKALDDLLDVPPDKVNDGRLYRAHTGPYYRVLSCLGHLAHSTTLVAKLRLGQCPQKAARRDGRSAISGHRPANRRRE